MKTNLDINYRNKLMDILHPYLMDYTQFGADHIGYRVFNSDGSSFGFTRNDG